MCVNVEIGPVGDTTKGFSQKTCARCEFERKECLSLSDIRGCLTHWVAISK